MGRANQKLHLLSRIQFFLPNHNVRTNLITLNVILILSFSHTGSNLHVRCTLYRSPNACIQRKSWSIQSKCTGYNEKGKLCSEILIAYKNRILNIHNVQNTSFKYPLLIQDSFKTFLACEIYLLDIHNVQKTSFRHS